MLLQADDSSQEVVLSIKVTFWNDNVTEEEEKCSTRNCDFRVMFPHIARLLQRGMLVILQGFLWHHS